jgi:hypothetical protein
MKPKKNPVTKLIGAGAKAAIKAVKPAAKPKKRVISNSRQVYDYTVPGLNAKKVVPKMGRQNAQISKNVNIKNAQSPSGKQSISGGAAQVMNQNARLGIKANKAEAKANARGLKAANKPTNKVGSKADKELRSRTKSVVMYKEETKASYDYYYGKGSGEGITQINKQTIPKNDARSVRKMPKKKSK